MIGYREILDRYGGNHPIVWPNVTKYFNPVIRVHQIDDEILRYDPVSLLNNSMFHDWKVVHMSVTTIDRKSPFVSRLIVTDGYITLHFGSFTQNAKNIEPIVTEDHFSKVANNSQCVLDPVVTTISCDDIDIRDLNSVHHLSQLDVAIGTRPTYKDTLFNKLSLPQRYFGTIPSDYIPYCIPSIVNFLSQLHRQGLWGNDDYKEGSSLTDRYIDNLSIISYYCLLEKEFNIYLSISPGVWSRIYFYPETNDHEYMYLCNVVFSLECDLSPDFSIKNIYHSIRLCESSDDRRALSHVKLNGANRYKIYNDSLLVDVSKFLNFFSSSFNNLICQRVNLLTDALYNRVDKMNDQNIL